ncbi:MAG: DUF2815 family protein [Lachnospiraceae bacterium]|nr:DUF2815 family protein [Lachnospiraceae bacterium]
MTTGKVRASYAHVFQPHTAPGSTDAKYSVTLLIPKTDAVTLNAIYSAIELAKQAGVQKTFGGVMPPVINTPIYDGDGTRPNGEPFGEECRGHMVLRASSKEQPSVVDLNVQPILNPAEVYSGCYIRASIDFFAYNQSGNRGIGCGLNAVQKIGDGEPLTSRTTAAEAFGGSNAYTGPTGMSFQPAAYPAAPTSMVPGSAVTQPAAPGDTGQNQAVPYASGYPQAVPYASGYPQAGAFVQPAIDPITGRPVSPGGVMGI